MKNIFGSYILVRVNLTLGNIPRVSVVPPPAASGQISAVLVAERRTSGGGGKGEEKGEWPYRDASKKVNDIFVIKTTDNEK